MTPSRRPPSSFPAEAPDVDLDHVRLGPEVGPPHRVDQAVLGEDVAGMTSEHLEKRELLGGQVHGAAAQPDDATGGIDLKVTGPEDGVPLGDAPPAQRPDAGEQLGGGEGLAQVVIGPGVQAGHAIIDRYRVRSASGSGPASRMPAVARRP